MLRIGLRSRSTKETIGLCSRRSNSYFLHGDDGRSRIHGASGSNKGGLGFLRNCRFCRFVAGAILKIGKGRVTKVDKNAKNKVYFENVASCVKAKQELMEVVNFLKYPNKIQEPGSKKFKGILLVGPPGTEKTDLAKATAAESGVHFLSISCSDIMGMFAWVGPSRVKHLFHEAQQCAPCLVFLDEIDTISWARNSGGIYGANDKSKDTLNQLLVEMNFLATTAGVVVLAGTNRPDMLHPGILKRGCFDYQIEIDMADTKYREQIYHFYFKKMKVDHEPSYSSQRLADLTPRVFTEADIAEVCREAAYLALQAGKTTVTMEHFEAAIEIVKHDMAKEKGVSNEMSENIILLEGPKCKNYLLGVHHGDKISIRQTRELINLVEPTCIFLELDESRRASAKSERNEFSAAIEESAKYGSQVILGDIEAQYKDYDDHRLELFKYFKEQQPGWSEEVRDNKSSELALAYCVERRNWLMIEKLRSASKKHSITVGIVGWDHLTGMAKIWKRYVWPVQSY